MFAGYKTLELYMYKTNEHKIFDKYEINVCSVIRHKETKNILSKRISCGYHKASVYDDDNKFRTISVSRAMLSTFVGKPPSANHTADHRRHKEKLNDNLINLRWFDKSQQRYNQERKTYNQNNFLICHDNQEMTAKEWAKKYDISISKIYNKIYSEVDWNYKMYDDLPNEIWKFVEGSINKKNWWEVSDKLRIAYHTKHARKIFLPNELVKSGDYPVICINGKMTLIHEVMFKTFYPDEYANKKSHECIMHLGDDKMNCDPHTLRIGDRSTNGKDAHDNGRYDGTKSQRRKCYGTKDGKTYEFESLHAAQKWLRENGHPKARFGNIIRCVNSNTRKIAYGFEWSY